MKIFSTLLLLSSIFVTSSFAEPEKKLSMADYLQNISVTIRAESERGASEGSGVVFTRKDEKGNLINLVWTAGHVVEEARSLRRALINGSDKVIVEFKDVVIIKEIRQGGRIVGSLRMDAEVLKYSNANSGHDLALLRIRKVNFIADSAVFFLDKEIPALGTDLLHVGSLLGQMGANSMTSGIMSQHGRVIKEINKYEYDQTTCTAFPGSSGGGVYLKSDARFVGMLVRGAGEGFNLVVPIRRMVSYCKQHEAMWALDHSVKMPTEEELKKMPIENTPEEKKDAVAQEKAGKLFPFLIHRTPPSP